MRHRSLGGALLVTFFAASLGACTPPVQWDAKTGCEMAQLGRDQMRRGASLSGADLVELTAGFPPAHKYAVSAQRQTHAILALSIIGAAALVAGFVMGFATDPTQQSARAAGYSLTGTALGVGAISDFGLVFGARHATRKAIRLLNNFAESCAETPPPITNGGELPGAQEVPGAQ